MIKTLIKVYVLLISIFGAYIAEANVDEFISIYFKI